MSTQQRGSSVGATGPHRSRVRRLVLVLALAVVLTVPLTGWYVVTADAAGSVRVEVPFERCRAATWVTRSLVSAESGLEEEQQVVAVTPRTRCVTTVRVVNDSSVAVHLDRAVAPYLGPAGGTILRVETAETSARSLDPDDLDAHLDLDETLEPGEATRFRIVLAYRPEGCASRGTLTIPGWPRVEMSVLGRDVSAEGPGPLAFGWARGARIPDCRL